MVDIDTHSPSHFLVQFKTSIIYNHQELQSEILSLTEFCQHICTVIPAGNLKLNHKINVKK